MIVTRMAHKSGLGTVTVLCDRVIGPHGEPENRTICSTLGIFFVFLVDLFIYLDFVKLQMEKLK